MAYNSCDRFPPQPYNYRLLDPGSFQFENSTKMIPSKAPFLTKSERNTQTGVRLWTHAIHNADLPSKIPNCSAMMSKLPRFPHEAFNKKKFEFAICKCGLENVCECSKEKEEGTADVCYAKIHRRLFRGPPPRSAISQGLSTPSRRDHGFQLLPDGTLKRIFYPEKEESPPFYDTRVNEPTAFYQGCKWSQWESTHSAKCLETGPGPADYNIERLNYSDSCTEFFRARKRKESKQLRYIEIIQEKELSENHPGPATYSPQNPKCTNIKFYGSKAERFQEIYNQSVGPADYKIKRQFDLPKTQRGSCHAKLSRPAVFGVKAARFKLCKEEGPSPATYDPKIRKSFTGCSSAAFGSSAQRFKDTPFCKIENNNAETKCNQDEIATVSCDKTTWEFKSKTLRLKPLQKKLLEPSPADFPMKSIHFERPKKLQFKSPFYSADGRFQPWFNWIPLLGELKTPGPGYYNIEKPTCQSAVRWGPLSKTERFPTHKGHQTPAPNAYNVDRGVETILTTHNQKLKNNIWNQHTFKWQPRFKSKILSLEERQVMLLNKAIDLLDVDADSAKSRSGNMEETENKIKPKLLRCFLYNNRDQLYY